MSDDRMDTVVEKIRETYNVPTETPQEQMWEAISGRLAERRTGTGPAHETAADVLDLTAVRDRRTAEVASATGSARFMGWAVAAAAVLVFGIGIGRMTAPGTVETAAVAPVGTEVGAASLTLAAQEHFGRTESLLTMVRTDARAGRVDPTTARWASGLLSQTRLLIDQDGSDLAVNALLLDLELLLVQIVGVSETGSGDEARARTELELALRSLEEGEVLPRIRAVLPPELAGT